MEAAGGLGEERRDVAAGSISTSMTAFRYYLRVRYIECDAQKVVFNSRYSEYVDVSMTEFLRAAGARRFTDGGRFQLVKQQSRGARPVRRGARTVDRPDPWGRRRVHHRHRVPHQGRTASSSCRNGFMCAG
jgi:hypothetical protein